MKTTIQKLEHLSRYRGEVAGGTEGVFVSIDLQPSGLRIRTTIERKGEYHHCIPYAGFEGATILELETEVDRAIQAAKDARPSITSRMIVHSVEEIAQAPHDPRIPEKITEDARMILLETIGKLSMIVGDLPPHLDLEADARDYQRDETRGALLDLVENVDTLLEQLKGGLNGVQIWAEFDRVLFDAKLTVDRTFRPGDRLRRLTAEETGARLKAAAL